MTRRWRLRTRQARATSTVCRCGAPSVGRCACSPASWTTGSAPPPPSPWTPSWCAPSKRAVAIQAEDSWGNQRTFASPVWKAWEFGTRGSRSVYAEVWMPWIPPSLYRFKGGLWMNMVLVRCKRSSRNLDSLYVFVPSTMVATGNNAGHLLVLLLARSPMKMLVRFSVMSLKTTIWAGAEGRCRRRRCATCFESRTCTAPSLCAAPGSTISWSTSESTARIAWTLSRPGSCWRLCCWAPAPPRRFSARTRRCLPALSAFCFCVQWDCATKRACLARNSMDGFQNATGALPTRATVLHAELARRPVSILTKELVTS